MLHGNVTLMVLAGTTLAVTLVKTGVVLYAGIRTVAVEIWIRRLGMGDFEYRIEPKGNDEVSKDGLALETLRQSSIRAMQLDLNQLLARQASLAYQAAQTCRQRDSLPLSGRS